CQEHRVVPHQEPGHEVRVRFETRSWKEQREAIAHVPRVELVPEKEEPRLEAREVREEEKHYVPRLEVITHHVMLYRPALHMVEETEMVPSLRQVKTRETEYRLEHRMVEREEVVMVPRLEQITERQVLYRPVARKIKRRHVEYGQRIEVTAERPRQ